MEKSYEQLIDILRLSVCDGKDAHADFSCLDGGDSHADFSCLDGGDSHAEFSRLSDDDIKNIISAGEFHSVEHIPADYLLKCHSLQKFGGDLASEDASFADSGTGLKASDALVSELQSLYNERLYSALIFDTDMAEIKSAFNEAGIDFIPLKGAHLRGLYPEKWMRSSLDIDILVRAEDEKRATDLLVEKHGFTLKLETGHHGILTSRTGWMVEIHHSLSPYETDAKAFLDDAWNYAMKVCSQGDASESRESESSVNTQGSHEYEFTHAFFYFYHIFHMAHHFIGGGCGVRAVLDLWLLIKHGYDAKAGDMLEKAGLSVFEKKAKALAYKWFGNLTQNSVQNDARLDGVVQNSENPDYSPEIIAMEDFIIAGGARGTKENIQLVRTSKIDGKIKYLLRRVFLPADVIKSQHPKAREHAILVPFYEVKRWFTALKRDGGANLKEDMAERREVSEEDAEKTAELIKDIGLERMR